MVLAVCGNCSKNVYDAIRIISLLFHAGDTKTLYGFAEQFAEETCHTIKFRIFVFIQRSDLLFLCTKQTKDIVMLFAFNEIECFFYSHYLSYAFYYCCNVLFPVFLWNSKKCSFTSIFITECCL